MSEENRYIVCAGCGRQVDPGKIPVYHDFKTGLNFCETCRRIDSAQKGKPRKKWASALRIIFGALFLIVGVDFIKDGDLSSALTSIILGGALLVWQFWPQLKWLVTRNRASAAFKRRSEAARTREEERVKVCSSCGGAGTGSTGPYCGMPFSGIQVIDRSDGG